MEDWKVLGGVTEWGIRGSVEIILLLNLPYMLSYHIVVKCFMNIVLLGPYNPCMGGYFILIL